MKSIGSYFLVGLLTSFAFAVTAHAETIDWVRQLGTADYDQSGAVSVDSLGNVYTSGYTGGSLSGPNIGYYDAFVSKFNAAGSLLWTRQLGTTDRDSSSGVSANDLGYVYISGTTGGNLAAPNAGNADAFVSKYNATGDLLWTRQFGTAGDDYGDGISADKLGNVYISGDTSGSLVGPRAGSSDIFLFKYDAGGSLLWTRQFGTSSTDERSSVSADGLGNVYVSGNTFGDLAGQNGEGDAFICKYDSGGNLLWTRQLGTTRHDHNTDLSADGLGNVYISGETEGNFGGPNAGSYDAFLSKYDTSGNLLWTRQFGTAGNDNCYSVSADDQGDVYTSGHIGAELGWVGGDAFVSKYNAAGDLLWTQQLRTTSTDVSAAISADGLGSVYFSGFTSGSLSAPNAGHYDAFIAKITDVVVPEPSAFALAAMSILGLICKKRRVPLALPVQCGFNFDRARPRVVHE